MNIVEMYHPELKTHVTVPESAVPMHRQSGWITGNDDNAKYEAPPAPPVEDTFDTVLPTGQVGPRQVVEGEPAEDEVEVPAKSAPKAEWQQAARDAGVPDEDVEGMTTKELQAEVARLTESQE
jgi:hypothetical protein